MNEAQALLNKISALREPALGAASTVSATPIPMAHGIDERCRVQQLERQVHGGARQNLRMEGSLRKLSDGTSSRESILPAQLISRARRLLERGKDLLLKQRALAAHFASGDAQLVAAPQDQDPLADLFRETVAMTETVLRIVQAFPDSPNGQSQLCEGLEAILNVASERIEALIAVTQRRREEAQFVRFVAQLAERMATGKDRDIKPWTDLADQLLAESLEGLPLRLLSGGPYDQADVPFAVARHSLNVARIMARLARHDFELRDRAADGVLAALVHDVGMLNVPASILTQTQPLEDSQRRALESHTGLGAELAAHLLPATPEWIDAIAHHHERLDGTGYPDGLREMQIMPAIRLLAVADVYAALCSERPQRPARDPRAALTDVLLLAEEGKFDRVRAERLLMLSFYPVGTVVELNDGALALVVATHMGRRDANTPSRPVVELLTDGLHRPLGSADHLDLSECEGRSIVRVLNTSERCELLGKRHPELLD